MGDSPTSAMDGCPGPAAGAVDEETRQCIRALVACIRASKGSGAAKEEQLTQMRKVVRILSMTPAEIDAAEPAQRAHIMSIRQSALDKMRMAKSSGPQYGTSPLCTPRSQPMRIAAPHTCGAGLKRVRRHSRGEEEDEEASDLAQSAPATFCRPGVPSSPPMGSSPHSAMNSMMGGMNLGGTPPGLELWAR